MHDAQKTTHAEDAVSFREVTAGTFQAEVLEAPLPVLVDFTATWCAPCRALTPVLEAVAAQTRGALSVVSVDGDSSPDVAARYGVRGFPTLILFVGGKEVGRQLGLANKEKVMALVRRASA